ncbi:MAG: hypothetical protein U9N44_01215 [Chloroflexota bacterium]|nr:hypothetical protein [Chloroflexota bacterium]
MNTSVSGQGMVSPPSGIYEDKEVITVAAIPASGWEFDRWEGDCNGSENPIAIRMDSGKIVKAYFTETGTPAPTVTATPTAVATLTPTATAYKSQCEIDRDAIQVALDAYHDTYGNWPTVDGLPGDIVWDKLVPEFMGEVAHGDYICDWRVNGDPEGEVCLPRTC